MAGSTLAPKNGVLQDRLRVPVPNGWTAKSGDVLEVVETYRLTAGAHTNQSVARSGEFSVA